MSINNIQQNVNGSNDFYSAEEELSYNEWLEPSRKKSDDDYKRDKNIGDKKIVIWSNRIITP